MENEELRDQTASELLSLDEEYRMQKSWAEDDDSMNKTYNCYCITILMKISYTCVKFF